MAEQVTQFRKALLNGTAKLHFKNGRCASGDLEALPLWINAFETIDRKQDADLLLRAARVIIELRRALEASDWATALRQVTETPDDIKSCDYRQEIRMVRRFCEVSSWRILVQ